MQEKYSIGLDFGTLSARALLVNVNTGEEEALSVIGYQDAIIDRFLPGTNIEVPGNFELQNPRDYIEALEGLLKDIWSKAKIDPKQVIGIGVDFTSCTMLPVDDQYIPLCFDPNYMESPHSWAKLWKHHGAQVEADHINKIAQERGEKFIKRYGNKSSSEWMFAKILEILNHAPKIYEGTYRFIEGCDFMIYLLTGNDKRNSCISGYKAFWNKQNGYPDESYFEALDPRMKNVIAEKIGTDVYPVGACAGYLTKDMADKTGLPVGIPVGVGNTDAHLAVPAVGVTEPGSMVLIMGTSLCHMLIDSKEVFPEGICGVVEDGILPGYFGYEAGQPAVGDIFDWFVSNITPGEYVQEALEGNVTIFDVMNAKAAALVPGESGLIALDWWNGNRSILVDSELSGTILGLTMQTRAEEIYRAIIEATAFGTRLIVESFLENDITIEHIYACGGLARKSNVVMQIFADVLGMEIKVSASKQTSALGAAMYGAVAAGSNLGGYDNIFEATKSMSRIKKESFLPHWEYTRKYDLLFAEYKKLHDLLGRKYADIMKNLRRLKSASDNTDN